MFLLILQLLVGLCVAACAIHMHRHLNPKPADRLDRIIAKLGPNDWGFATVSHGSFFSEGLAVAVDESWQRTHGMKGLWCIFWNVGALVELADYVAATQTSNPRMWSTVQELRASALQVRILALSAGLRHLVTFGVQKKALATAYQATTLYSSVLAGTSYVVHDYSPWLLRRYLNAMGTA